LGEQFGVIPAGDSIFVSRRAENEFLKVTAAFAIKYFATIGKQTTPVVPVIIAAVFFNEIY